MLKLKHVKTYYGANPYVDKKAMVFEIEYDLEKSNSNFETRAQEILDSLPIDFDVLDLSNTKSHTDFISYLSLELLNYARGDLRFSFATDNLVCIEFHNPNVNFFVFGLISQWFSFDEFNVDKFSVDLRNIWAACKKNHPDFQAHALIEYAKSSSISYHNLGRKIWVYGTGRGAHVFFETSLFEDMNGQKLSKDNCKSIFHEVCVRYPKYICKSEFKNLDEVIEEIQFPCVVKPNDSGGGKGVTANINDIHQLDFAIKHAKSYSKSGAIVVEEHLLGFDHRILVVSGEFKGCVKSEAPFVIGDGKKTINELIAEKNKFRTVSFFKSRYKRPIIVDDALINKLHIQNLRISDIIDSGQKIYLRNNSNLGGGGDSVFVKEVHPDIINHALKIANNVGMFSTGIDYITEDISKSPEDIGGGFTELNKVPGVPVFVNAGFSPAAVGSFFLKGICWDVPLDIYIVDQNRDRIGELFKNSYIFPNLIIKDKKLHKLNYPSFDECWGRYVSDRSLDRLEFLINEKFLKNFGVLEGATNVFVFSRCSVDTTNFLEACRVNFTVIDQKVDN